MFVIIFVVIPVLVILGVAVYIIRLGIRDASSNSNDEDVSPNTVASKEEQHMGEYRAVEKHVRAFGWDESTEELMKDAISCILIEKFYDVIDAVRVCDNKFKVTCTPCFDTEHKVLTFDMFIYFRKGNLLYKIGEDDEVKEWIPKKGKDETTADEILPNEKALGKDHFFSDKFRLFEDTVNDLGWDDTQVINLVEGSINLFLRQEENFELKDAVHISDNRYRASCFSLSDIKSERKTQTLDIYIYFKKGHFFYKIGEGGKLKEWIPQEPAKDAQ